MTKSAKTYIVWFRRWNASGNTAPDREKTAVFISPRKPTKIQALNALGEDRMSRRLFSYAVTITEVQPITL